MEPLTVYEVGLRDGLQNEKTILATAEKLELISQLVGAGLRRMEVASFVSPKAVPQMADAVDVVSAAVESWPEASISSLVLTEGGYERAVQAGCRTVAVVVIASESLSRRNSRMGVEESLRLCRRVVERARSEGVRTRVYLSAAWSCPYEGVVPPKRVLSLAESIWQAGPDEIAVADSVGYAHPGEVEQLLTRLGQLIGGMEALAVHFHDTLGFGLANAAAALSAGIRTIDASIGGLGGCPFAVGAAGNLATEDLVLLAQKMGFDTGVRLASLWETVEDLDRVLGRRVGGRTRTWWESIDRTTQEFVESPY